MIAAAAAARKGSMQRAAPAQNPTLSDAIKKARRCKRHTRPRFFGVPLRLRSDATPGVWVAYSLPFLCCLLAAYLLLSATRLPPVCFSARVISGGFWTHPRARVGESQKATPGPACLQKLTFSRVRRVGACWYFCGHAQARRLLSHFGKVARARACEAGRVTKRLQIAPGCIACPSPDKQA